MQVIGGDDVNRKIACQRETQRDRGAADAGLTYAARLLTYKKIVAGEHHRPWDEPPVTKQEQLFPEPSRGFPISGSRQQLVKYGVPIREHLPRCCNSKLEISNYHQEGQYHCQHRPERLLP